MGFSPHQVPLVLMRFQSYYGFNSLPEPLASAGTRRDQVHEELAILINPNIRNVADGYIAGVASLFHVLIHILYSAYNCMLLRIAFGRTEVSCSLIFQILNIPIHQQWNLLYVG